MDETVCKYSKYKILYTILNIKALSKSVIHKHAMMHNIMIKRSTNIQFISNFSNQFRLTEVFQYLKGTYEKDAE